MDKIKKNVTLIRKLFKPSKGDVSYLWKGSGKWGKFVKTKHTLEEKNSTISICCWKLVLNHSILILAQSENK